MTDIEKELFDYIVSLNLNDKEKERLTILATDWGNQSYQMGWNDVIENGMKSVPFEPYVSGGSRNGDYKFTRVRGEYWSFE